MKNLLKKDIVLSYTVLVFLLTSFLLLPYYRYQTDADAISYISIAQKYSFLNFKDALNGYWGPLLSWIVAPFLVLNIEPLLTTKIILIIIGAMTIIATRKLSFIFSIDKNTNNIILAGLIPIFIFFSSLTTNPDLITVLILFSYLNIIFDEKKYLNNHNNGWHCGILGALGYFCKSYLFYFFLANFIIINIIYFFQTRGTEQAKILLKMFFQALLIFAIISGVWITLLSFKYHKFTVGTAGNYNRILIGPTSNKKHLIELDRILTPPNNSATSAWEDPSLLNDYADWSVFKSWQHFEYYLILITKNIKNTFFHLTRFSPLSLPILIGLYFLSIKKNPIAYKIITTITTYCTGYLLILVEKRYLWPVYILLILSGGYILSIFFENNKHSLFIKRVASLAIIISFLGMPVFGLITYKDMNKNTFEVAQKIKKHYHIRGSLVDNYPEGGASMTLPIAFHLKSRYFGRIIKMDSEENFKNMIKQHDIDYYLSYEDNELPFLKKYPEELHGEIPGLKIYNLSSIK